MAKRFGTEKKKKIPGFVLKDIFMPSKEGGKDSLEVFSEESVPDSTKAFEPRLGFLPAVRFLACLAFLFVLLGAYAFWRLIPLNKTLVEKKNEWLLSQKALTFLEGRAEVQRQAESRYEQKVAVMRSASQFNSQILLAMNQIRRKGKGASEILSGLSKWTSDGVWFKKCEIIDSSWRIQAYAFSERYSDWFLESLRRSAYFKSVQLISRKPALVVGGEEIIFFEVTGEALS